MNKKIVALTLIISTANTYSMLKIYPNDANIRLKHAPIIHQENTHVKSMRTTLGFFCQDDHLISLLNREDAKILQSAHAELEGALVQSRRLYKIRRAVGEEKEYDCALYALAKVIGLKECPILASGGLKGAMINIFKYFKQTNNPQKNDLVIYSTNKKDIVSAGKHTGIFIKNNVVESKWGRSLYIVEHPFFHIPESYGNYAFFFTLKNKFRRLPKELFINLIHHDVAMLYGNTSAKWRDVILQGWSLLAHLDATEAIRHLSVIDI